jgi:hypothetical protein
LNEYQEVQETIENNIFGVDIAVFGEALTVFGKVDNTLNSSQNLIPSQNMVC